MTIREIVQSQLASVVEESSPIPFPATIHDDDLLEAFGLDSVAYTSLLTRIEGEVGYIPTAILEGDFYPETFGELVSAYQTE